MKNANANQIPSDADDMRPEYDFTGGIRGKHAEAYRSGHTASIHQTDGTTVVQHFRLEEGAVVLAPDVRAYFPDAAAVNHALRTLISLVPHQHDEIDAD